LKVDQSVRKEKKGGKKRRGEEGEGGRTSDTLSYILFKKGPAESLDTQERRKRGGKKEESFLYLFFLTGDASVIRKKKRKEREKKKRGKPDSYILRSCKEPGNGRGEKRAKRGTWEVETDSIFFRGDREPEGKKKRRERKKKKEKNGGGLSRMSPKNLFKKATDGEKKGEGKKEENDGECLFPLDF